MKENKEKASITVEAALFLPIFLMAFLTIYNLVYFARAQVLMQYAADQAAKEVAQYSYILEKTGILSSLDGLNTRADDFEAEIRSIQKNLETIQSAGEKAAQGQDVANNVIQAGNAAEDTYDKVKNYVKNPDEFLNGVLTAFKRDAMNGISSYMVNTVAKSCMDQQLAVAGGNRDLEEYKKILGISNISMKKTTWCQNKTRDVKIVVDFDLNSKLPYFTMEPRHYRVYASTRVWCGA